MRAGGCTVQQALTFESTAVVKQAVALARRRGHAQVTPLHVASTMLSASNGILRTACLQSHSHPLQCKALELCFNVALNRLPASSSSSPILSPPPHSPNPTISNALVAAFKRAQAHQRRGTIENPQQPLLAVKIEIEQLIISILDDPSVSRVMREAGFSSTQVKSNIEQVVTLEYVPSSITSNLKENSLVDTMKISKTLVCDPAKDEDVATVLEGLIKKKRGIVVVGECLVTLENVVKGVKDKFEKGDVQEELKDMKFISVPLATFNHLANHEVNEKIEELGRMVRGNYSKGVVLYTGDLKPWMIDYKGNNSHGDHHVGRNRYSPVEQVIVELGKMLCGVEEKGKCWILGIATFSTYTRCRSSHLLIESRWGLHPITLPAGSLGLSLTTERITRNESRSNKAESGSYQPLAADRVEEFELACCADCSEKFEAEARIMQKSESTVSCLPSWLKDESARLKHNHQNSLPVGELCRKWNSICSSLHKETKSLEKSSNFSSTGASPSSSVSVFSYDQQFHDTSSPHSPASFQLPFWAPVSNDSTRETDQRMQEPKLTFPPFSNSGPNSRSSSSDIMEIDYYVPRYKEFNSENLRILCNALEQKVPWQREVVSEIAGTILQCRSGMSRRKGKLIDEETGRTNAQDHIRTSSTETKEETWLLFHGPDARAKEKIARELAKVVFGSYSKLISISSSNFSCVRVDSNEGGFRNKRFRDEEHSSYIGKIAKAISDNPHRVILVEALEQADVCSQVEIKRAIERGKISSDFSIGEEVSLGDAIIILCCESFSSRSRNCSPEENGAAGDGRRSISPTVNLDLNISVDDQKVLEYQSVDHMGILERVDGLIVFRQELHDDLRLDVNH